MKKKHVVSQKLKRQFYHSWSIFWCAFIFIRT